MSVLQKASVVGLAIYAALLVLAVLAYFMIRNVGLGLVAPPANGDIQGVVKQQLHQVPVMFHVLLCLAAVVLLGNSLGWVCKYVGQPPVIGEVAAGILLGPSLLGYLSPESMRLLIPASEIDPDGKVSTSLKAISQLGVVLYMFLVGLELDAAGLKKRAHSAIAISHASIAFPFVLGAALALWIYPVFSNSAIEFTAFSLFCGIAMSITAFPVLARILTDRKIQHTGLGTVALGCAAADDVTAWCLLAIVVGVAKSDLTGALYVLGGAALFIVAMYFVVRPLLQRYARKSEDTEGEISGNAIVLLMAAVLVSSFITEAIGIHALFGAFLLGAIMPSNARIGREFATRFRDPIHMLLLPAFFAYTGMRTQVGMVQGLENWMWCAVIIAVATLGKFGGTFVAAKISGESWRDSAALGTLMNTRGLMELIVLNIGLDLGIISPMLFTMMVIMALVTTVATAPILRLLVPVNQISPSNAPT